MYNCNNTYGYNERFDFELVFSYSDVDFYSVE